MNVDAHANAPKDKKKECGVGEVGKWPQGDFLLVRKPVVPDTKPAAGRSGSRHTYVGCRRRRNRRRVTVEPGRRMLGKESTWRGRGGSAGGGGGVERRGKVKTASRKRGDGQANVDEIERGSVLVEDPHGTRLNCQSPRSLRVESSRESRQSRRGVRARVSE